MNDNEHLTHLMRRSVDDHEITTPDLLPRAKASRTRRRVGGVAGVAVLVAAGAFAVNSTLASTNVATPEPAEPAPSTAPAEPAPSVRPTEQALSNEEVALRCQSQLDAYNADPDYVPEGFADPAWQIAHTDQQYRVGDAVLFLDPSKDFRWPLCIVPAEGDAPTEIPDPAPSLDNPERLLGLCSQYLHNVLPPESDEQFIEGNPTRHYDFETPDLRGATIVAGAEEAGNVTALLKLGDAFYTCDQAGLDGDLPNSVTREPSYASGDEFPGAGLAYFLPGNGKSDDPSVRPYLAGSGHVPVKRATSFVIDGHLSVEIAEDGSYAFIEHTQPKQSGAMTIDYLDAEGNVLHTSTDGGDPYIVP